MLLLKKGLESSDKKKIISALIKLRNPSMSCKIKRQTFEILVELIKMPNPVILNYTLSILANCCVKTIYQNIFKETGGLTHVFLIISTIDNDSIICRACRLIGNLASNPFLLKEMCTNNVGLHLIKLIEKHDNWSSDTLQMIFRALEKVFRSKEFKRKGVPQSSLSVLTKNLDSENEQLVCQTIKMLVHITDSHYFKTNKLKADQELFLKLMNLAKNEDLNHLVISTLSNLIYYQLSSIARHLEGSNIAEIYIEYFQKNENISERVYKAFCCLCTIGAMRCKVRLSGLLLKLIDSSNSTNVKSLLDIFCLFQYDLDSMMICSKHPKFFSIVINNITRPGSVQLLAVLSRLEPPNKELVLHHNLDVLIQNERCHKVLRHITRIGQFLKPILLSGKVWQIEKIGCPMDDICTPESIEYLLMQLLSSNDKDTFEHVSLAIPFLVKPSYFHLLHKLLVRYNVITTILNLLEKNATDERILATIIRLIDILKYNYREPDNFFRDFVGGDVGLIPEVETSSSEAVERNTELDNGNVTFELDSGSCVEVNKNLICRKSPVLNSMLNGHFVEATQERIRLKKCTEKGILLLVDLLNGETDIGNIEIEVHLELLSLTDRFLLPELNTMLTNKLNINTEHCPYIYKWYKEAGFTKNNCTIGQKVYEFMFSFSENLLSAMRYEECKIYLVNEISQYLSNFYSDTSPD